MQWQGSIVCRMYVGRNHRPVGLNGPAFNHSIASYGTLRTFLDFVGQFDPVMPSARRPDLWWWLNLYGHRWSFR